MRYTSSICGAARTHDPPAFKWRGVATQPSDVLGFHAIHNILLVLPTILPAIQSSQCCSCDVETSLRTRLLPLAADEERIRPLITFVYYIMYYILRKSYL